MPLFPDESLPVSRSILKQSVTGQTTAIKLAAAKRRRLITVFNASFNTLYIDFGPTVSKSDFAAKIPPQGYYESPYPDDHAVMGIWDGAGGKAFIREFV